MKKNLILNSFALSFLLTGESFALEKNLDFYQNKTIISFDGELKDFENISFNENILYLNNVKKDSFIRLNNKAGLVYHYNKNNNLYSTLKNNIGKTIEFENKEYILFNVSETYIILEDKLTEKLIYLNDITKLKTPKEWFTFSENYKIQYKDKINQNDNIFYSYEDTNLKSLNKYEIILNSNKELKFTHFIEVENVGNNYKNVNLSFFHGDMNINSQRQPIFYAKSNIEMESLESNTNFEENEISNIKVINLKDVSLHSGLNKFNYKDINFDYNNYVKIESNYIIKNTFHNSMDIENIKEQITFKNYIEFEPKENIFPFGSISIYEDNRLIVSDNLNYTENKLVSLYKNKNNDLKVEDILFEKLDDNKNKIVEIKLKNTSKEKYLLKMNDDIYEINPEEKLNIKIK